MGLWVRSETSPRIFVLSVLTTIGSLKEGRFTSHGAPQYVLRSSSHSSSHVLSGEESLRDFAQSSAKRESHCHVSRSPGGEPPRASSSGFSEAAAGPPRSMFSESAIC